MSIYPNPVALRKAARRYNRERGSDETFTDTLGVCQPAHLRSRFDSKTKTWNDSTSSLAAIVRLSAEHLTREIVAHEAVHASLAVWRQHQWSKNVAGDCDATVNLGDDCGPIEETYAHLAGLLTSDMLGIAQHVLGRKRLR